MYLVLVVYVFRMHLLGRLQLIFQDGADQSESSHHAENLKSDFQL